MTGIAKEIARHQQLYDEGRPELSDDAFDALVESAGAENIVHERPRSHRQTTHPCAVLSLQKLKSLDDLVSWATRTAPTKMLLAEWKLDGLALVLSYVDGDLTDAATRGDGRVGDSVMRAANVIPNLPSSTSLAAPRDLVVRGEVVMPRTVFREKYAKTFATARNAVVGAVMSGDAGVLEDCAFIAHDLLMTQMSQLERRSILVSSNFTVVPAKPALNIRGTWTEHTTKRADYAYDTDGVVFKFNDAHHLGETEHHPRWAAVLKWPAPAGRATLKRVVWQVSRAGVLTPVAETTPVVLGGVTVTRATLHNAANVEALELREGDELVMSRRGDVIPHVEGIAAPGTGPYAALPVKCPGCGGLAVRVGDGLRCLTPQTCPEVLIGRVKHWCRTTGMEGWGDAIVRALVDADLVTGLGDVYRVPEATIANLAGYGSTSAAKLISERDTKSTLSLQTFLCALGLPLLARSAAAKIVKVCRTLADLLSMSAAELARIPGIGTVRARVFITALDAAVPDILDLRSVVTLIDYEAVENAVAGKSAPKALSGEVVVFTGALSDKSRAEAEDEARTLGAATPGNVTRETTILVVGDGALPKQTGKRDRAKKLNQNGANIQIITESEWTKIVANG